MVMIKGALVVAGSILWLFGFPLFLCLEAIRYGLDLLLDTCAAVWHRWEEWRNAV